MAQSLPPALDAELRRLTLRTLAAGSLGQLLLAALLHQAFPLPVRPLLIDRGGCGLSQWQALLRRYGDLHQHDLLGQHRYSPVVQVSVFGERLTPSPPAPRFLGATPPVGVRDGRRMAALRARYPSALVLACEG